MAKLVEVKYGYDGGDLDFLKFLFCGFFLGPLSILYLGSKTLQALKEKPLKEKLKDLNLDMDRELAEGGEKVSNDGKHIIIKRKVPDPNSIDSHMYRVTKWEIEPRKFQSCKSSTHIQNSHNPLTILPMDAIPEEFKVLKYHYLWDEKKGKFVPY